MSTGSDNCLTIDGSGRVRLMSLLSLPKMGLAGLTVLNLGQAARGFRRTAT